MAGIRISVYPPSKPIFIQAVVQPTPEHRIYKMFITYNQLTSR